MNYLKAAMGTTALLIVGLLGFMYFTFDADFQYQQAMEAFQKDQITEAEDYLESTGEQQSVQHRLCHSYLSRAKGDFQSSNAELKEAEALLKPSTPPQFSMEIVLGQALNAVLQKDRDALELAVSKGEAIEPVNPHLRRFKAVLAQWDNRPKEALEFWQPIAAGNPFTSGWLATALNENFSGSWVQLQRASCELEAGDYLAARRRLESLQKKADPKDSTEISFLLGLTYIREGEARPERARPSYLKLALGHLDQVPLKQERFDQAREEIAEQLAVVGAFMVQNGEMKELPLYCRTLADWDAEAKLQKLGKTLLNKVQTAVEDGDWAHVQEWGSTLSQHFDFIAWEQKVQDKLSKAIRELLDQGQPQDAQDSWEIARTLSADPRKLEDKTAQSIKTRILELVEEDEQTLPVASAYLAFWESIERDGTERLQLAQTLLKRSRHYWLNRGWEERATRLMTLANSLPFLTEKSQFDSQLCQVLKVVAQEAAQTDNATKLARVYEAMDQFQIKRVGLQDQSETSNQLADARYLFDQGRFHDAEKRLKVILTLSPEHPEANCLKALTRYKLRDYKAALELLHRCKNNDSEMLEAKAVTQIVMGDPMGGVNALKEQSRVGAVSDEALGRAAFALLNRNDTEGARHLIAQMKAPNWEAKTAFAFAAWKDRHWADALASYERLSPSLNRWKGLRLLVAACLGELGRVDEGELIVHNVLKSSEPNLPPVCSPEFKDFKAQHLDTISPEHMAALFYRDYRKDHRKALQCFLQMEEKSPAVLLAIAETQLLTGDTHGARKHFEEIVTTSAAGPSRTQALRALGAIYLDLNMPYRAEQVLREAYLQADKDVENRVRYAKLLETLGRWDLVLEHYRELKIQQQLAVELIPSYVKSLLMNDQNKAAKHQLRQSIDLLNRGNSATRLQAALLARQLELPDIAQALVSQADDLDSVDSQIAAMRLAIGNGNLAQAESLAGRYRTQLEQSANGLAMLAMVSEAAGNTDDALALAYRALKRDATHRVAFFVLSRIEKDWKKSEERLTSLRKLLEHENIDAAMQLAYASQLWLFAEQRFQAGDMPEEGYEYLLQEVISSLQKVTEEFPDYSAPRSLLGRVAESLEERDMARTAYEKALGYNRADSQAYQGLARLALEEGKADKAKQYLQQALRYNPEEPELWKDLAELCLETQDHFSARTALEKAVLYRPSDVKMLTALGTMLMRLQNPEQAHQVLQRAMILKPQDQEVCSLLLRSLYDALYPVQNDEGRRQLQKARRDTYNRLFALNPERARQTLIQCQGGTTASAL